MKAPQDLLDPKAVSVRECPDSFNHRVVAREPTRDDRHRTKGVRS
jgi:hypothetical protein